MLEIIDHFSLHHHTPRTYQSTKQRSIHFARILTIEVLLQIRLKQLSRYFDQNKTGGPSRFLDILSSVIVYKDFEMYTEDGCKIMLYYGPWKGGGGLRITYVNRN